MKKRLTAAVLLASLILVAAGCGKEKYEPSDIVEGVDKCDVCQMMIADDHNATQIILKDGQTLKFDDIGDLFVWRSENDTDKIGASYVRDYHSSEWIKLEDAYFAYSPTFETPMAYGVYSFESKSSAEDFVAEQGEGTVLTYDDLLKHDWERSSSHGHDHGHSHDHDEHEEDHNHSSEETDHLDQEDDHAAEDTDH